MIQAIVDLRFRSKANLQATIAKIRAIEGVQWATLLYGSRDGAALVRCETMDELSKIVLDILRVPGVERTETNIMLNIA